ncbi:WH2 domain [Phytophthora cactorum]|nr:WH2 domain [Phytophthora cactorum]
MGSGSWVVQEGFLLCKRDGSASPRSEGGKPPNWKPTASSKSLKELYVVLTMNRKLEFFDGSDAETRNKVDSAYLQGFGGWDGDGLLKVDSYGLELKVERNAKSRMHLAAFNRVDLEKCAAGEEVRRERRRVKKEEKRLQQEREEQIRKWKEKKARMIKEEQDRLLAREEEINNMTPLERIDDIGSLDDDTARMLEKRKQRLQRRQAPTMGRVNKAAYRRRLDEAAGGKTENVQPLHTKMVEQKAKVRVELPPPGQFFEVGGVVHNDAPVRLGSSGSDISDSSSMSSRLSSVSSVTGSRHDGGMGNLPPPPPPPRWSSSSRISITSRASMGIPPPPPPPPLFDHESFNDGEPRFQDPAAVYAVHRLTRSPSIEMKILWHPAHKGKQHIQDNLAAILGGGRPKSASRASRTSRRDSFGSTMSSITTASYAVPERKAKVNANRSNGSNSPPAPEPSMANAFAASLAAIRRNRADTVEEMSVASSALSPVAASGKVRNRKRDSQLSAEGKEILKKAMAQDVPSKPKTKANSGRRGLFDDSSSEEDDDSDAGLFGVGARKSKAANGTSRASTSMRSSDLSVDARPTPGKKAAPAPSVSSEEVSSDSDSDNETSFFAQPRKTEPTSPKNVRPSVVVLLTTSALRTEGRKSVGVFTFTLQFGNMEHTFSFTYSELEEIHTRLTPAFPGTTLPKFPSKHRLRNNTKPENMEKRAQEFRLYLQQLVALPGVLSSERFQFEYHIDGAFARALANGQKPNESATNGAQSNGRPPRSPVAPQPRKEPTALSAPSRSDSPPPRAAKPKASKGLFGLDSDPESDSDTSVDTPKPMTRQRRESAASSTQRRKPRTSDFSSSVIKESITFTAELSSEFQGELCSSSTSCRTSKTVAVTGLPPGRPNRFAGGRGDLLAAIRQGAQLKKATSGDSAGDSSSGGALAAAKPPPPPALSQPGSINEAITNAMAMRRIHVEYEETKSNADSDSDDDWD